MNESTILLEEQIKAELETLAGFEPGSEEHSKAVDDLVKLYKLKLEETKSEVDVEKERDDAIIRGKELDIREAELKEAKFSKWFKYGIDLMGIGAPLVFYAAWMKRGFKFEENGTICSSTFKGLINKFRTTR